VRLIPDNASGLHRKLVLLAPGRLYSTIFDDVNVEPSVHRRLLLELQALRGRIYLQDGAIEPWQLSVDGRHVQAADYKSWHLLTLDDNGKVAACTRYLPHANNVTFSELTVAHSALGQSEAWGRTLRSAIEAELAWAKQRRCCYVEMGGWAISESLRCTTEAVRMVVSAYGLAQLLGGALGISTVTTRHSSSSILRRIGGGGLRARGTELPPYYDPQYKCEMEILRFDSASPNPRYRAHVEDCRRLLRTVSVVCPQPVDTNFERWLPQLQAAVVGSRQMEPLAVGSSWE